MKKNLVVIGNGMAGARAVEEILAREGHDLFNITMFGDEPYGNYNRILLSNVLNGTQQEKEIFLNPIEWYRENDITLHVGVYAESILRKSKCVLGADGSIEPYDRLIIATGSRSHVPSIEGVTLANGLDKPGVFVFRTLDDCREIAEYAKACSGRAAIIGGGLLGLEAARGLQSYGVQVDVIHRGQYLMNQQLDAQAGAILKSTIEQMNIGVLLGKNTTAVFGDERVTGLRFADGSVLQCDMVVMAAGIKPNIEIAHRCGLQVQRAIVVDNQMRSVSDPDIYVVGECAQHRGHVYGLVAPLWEQAKVLADHITGRDTNSAYHGSKVATKLKVMGVEMAAMGITEPIEERDEIVQFTEPKKGTYKKLIIRDGGLVGAILLGDISKAAYLMQAFDRGTPLPEERLSLLFDIGAPSNKAAIEDMSADMQVCNCNGISKGAILSCVEAGKRSPKAVMDSTRAGLGCGSCKSMVSEIVQFACGGEVDEDPSVHYYVPGIPLTKPELTQRIREKGLKSVSAVFEALADGREDAASKPGLASLLSTIWADEYIKEPDARFINERVHANIQKDGTFSVVPMMAGGITSPAELRKIADVAEKYKVPMVKLTGGQRIDLLGLKKEDLPKIWQDLGIPSGHAYGKTYRTCKSCVGTDFCRFGLGDSTSLAIRIEQKFKGIDTPHKIKMATAGCPRNCSEAIVKDIRAVAVEGGKWEIYVGGAAGAHVRQGDILCVVDSHENVLEYAARFMQYYRENAKYLERTYGFVERVGIQKIRTVVVEDSEGIATRLDAAIQASIDAYEDPWKQSFTAGHPTQFTSLLPIVQ